MLIGVRENERGAQSYGVNVIGAKLTAFAVSGFLAAFAGCLFVHHQQSLGISAYLPQESLKAFVMVVIGGLGSVPGALIGAAYLQGVTYFASDLPAAVRNLVTFLSTGLGVVVVLLVLPGGLGSLLYRCATGCSASWRNARASTSRASSPTRAPTPRSRRC